MSHIIIRLFTPFVSIYNQLIRYIVSFFDNRYTVSLRGGEKRDFNKLSKRTNFHFMFFIKKELLLFR